MDKLLGLGDIFNTSAGSFNPLLIVPVLVVVLGAVAVFMFGFKKPDNMQFKKSENSSSKKQKRSNVEAPSAARQSSKVTPKAKPIKKEAVDIVTVKATTIVTSTAAAKKNTSAAATAANLSNPIKGKNTKGQAAKKAANTKEGKSAAKNAEKPLDSAAVDGGEWQTVVTKKQKKPTNDLLIQAVAKAAAGASVKVDAKNAKNNKQAKEQANKTKKATSEQQKLIDTTEAALPVDNKVYKEQIETKLAAPVTVAAPAPTIPIANAAPVNLQASEVEVPTADILTENNLAFDELGDATWTEAKTPKKSKKRALRE